MIFFEQLICYFINKIQILGLTPNKSTSRKLYFWFNIIKWQILSIIRTRTGKWYSVTFTFSYSLYPISLWYLVIYLQHSVRVIISSLVPLPVSQYFITSGTIADFNYKARFKHATCFLTTCRLRFKHLTLLLKIPLYVFPVYPNLTCL